MIKLFLEFRNKLSLRYLVAIVLLGHLDKFVENLLQKSAIRCNDNDIKLSQYGGLETPD